jgi:hypothetical protein
MFSVLGTVWCLYERKSKSSGDACCSHVHLNEPGRTEWEGFLTGTMAAVAGMTVSSFSKFQAILQDMRLLFP